MHRIACIPHELGSGLVLTFVFFFETYQATHQKPLLETKNDCNKLGNFDSDLIEALTFVFTTFLKTPP